MSMIFLGVPIFDWVLLVVVLGLCVEAWLTCRVRDDEPPSGDDPASESPREREPPG